MKGGTVYKEGNKWIWKSPYYLEDGKKKRHRIAFDTEEQAIAKQQAYLHQMTGGDGNNFIVGLTVREAYKKWVALAWLGNEEYISFNTQKGYVNAFNKHILPYIGDFKIDNLNPRALNLHFEEMAKQGLSRKTITNVKSALVKLLSYCKDVGWIDVFNADKIKIPKTKRPARKRVVNTITKSEYEQLYKHLLYNCSKFAPIVKFLRWTGLRIEEAGAVRESDIMGNKLLVCRAVKRKGYEHSDTTTLLVSDYLKTSAAYRIIPLSKQALKAIEEQREIKAELGIDSIYLFCTGAGNPREARNVLRAIHDACDDIGIEHRGAHCFRKLYCKTLIDDAKLDWEQVRILMGHEDVRVTKNCYYDMDDDDIDDIAKIMSKLT